MPTGGATATEKICELYDQRPTPKTIMEGNDLVCLFLPYIRLGTKYDSILQQAASSLF